MHEFNRKFKFVQGRKIIFSLILYLIECYGIRLHNHSAVLKTNKQTNGLVSGELISINN